MNRLGIESNNNESFYSKTSNQQFVIGRKLIQDTEITTAKRSGALPGFCAALKEICVTPKWNEKVLEVLERRVLKGE